MDKISFKAELKKGKAAKPKEEDVIAQWKRESEQMMLTDLFVNRPFWTLAIGYFLLGTLTLISVENNYFEVSDSSSRDFYIWSD